MILGSNIKNKYNENKIILLNTKQIVLPSLDQGLLWVRNAVTEVPKASGDQAKPFCPLPSRVKVTLKRELFPL